MLKNILSTSDASYHLELAAGYLAPQLNQHQYCELVGWHLDKLGRDESLVERHVSPLDQGQAQILICWSHRSCAWNVSLAQAS